MTTTAERTAFNESTTLTEATRGQQPSGRRMRIKLIDAGWGSSGYYSPKVLAEAAKAGVFSQGTHMYLNHPSLSEAVERPERSVKDLAAVLTSPAEYADGALYAETRVFGPFQELLAEQKDAIGVSIRAAGTAEPGEADGRKGMIISSLTEGISVDFVTAAGRGGQIVELLESARAELREGRNIGAWLESRLHLSFTALTDDMYGGGRLNREERIILSGAIGDALTAFTTRVEADAPQLYTRDLWDEPDEPDAAGTVEESHALTLREGHGMTANDLGSAICKAVREAYGGPKRYAWTRDYTDDWVVYTVETDKDTGLYQQSYTVDERTGAVALSGKRAEVNARTTYVPVGAPPPGSNPLKEGIKMSGSTQSGAPNGGATDTKPADIAEAEKKVKALETQLAEAREKLERRSDHAVRAEEAVQEANRLRDENHRFRALETARSTVATALAESGLPETAWPRVTAAVVGHEGAGIPLTEAGAIDSDKLKTAIESAITDMKSFVAGIAEAHGIGKVRGLGASTGKDGELSEADLEKGLTDIFESIGLPSEQAKLAAKGR